MGTYVGNDGDVYDLGTGRWLGRIDDKGQEQLAALTVFDTPAGVAAKKAANVPYAAGSVVIHPSTGAVLGTIDGDGDLSSGGIGLTAESQTSATANTAALNTALGSGGRVTLPAGLGDVYINGTVYLGERAQLDMGPGTRLRMIDNAGGLMMLSTVGYQTSATTVTVTWSAGIEANVAWASHGLTNGDAVVLQGEAGTTAAAWWRVCRITVVDANNVKVALPFLPTASPTGTMTARRCTRHIRVRGELDYAYRSGNNTTGNINRIASNWAFIADSHIELRVRDAFKYGGQLAGAIDTHLGVILYGEQNSDAVKVYGPSRSVTAHAVGTATEDTVSIQALEPAAFLAYMPCRGNIDGVTIRNMDAFATTAGSGGAVVYEDDTFNIRGIVFDGGNARADASNAAGVVVKVGSGFSPASSLVKDVTYRDVRIASGAYHGAYISSVKARSVVYDRCHFAYPSSNSFGLFRMDNSSQLDEVVFKNCVFELTGWPTSGVWAMTLSGVTVNSFRFIGCTVRASSSCRFILLSSGNTIRELVFEDCDAEGIDHMVRVASGQTVAPKVSIRGGRYNNCTGIANFQQSGKLTISHSPTFIGVTGGVARCEGASTVVDIHAHGAGEYLSSAVPFVCLTSATVNVYAPHLSLDIGATGVNKPAGGACFNTGAGRGTIAQNRLVICNGTNWVQADNLANTF